MGKKGKDKKKGLGAEKTALKTEKKLSAKHKKELAASGEDDIEAILAQIEKEDKERLKVVEVVVQPPTRRINFTFLPHPTKDELILFGGEFYNGKNMFVYNELFFYNIPKNEWRLVKVPGGPPARCGHQMVTVATNKGQLWMFGGEFASATQSQFYHYRDLWVFHIAKKRWEKITAPNGPSARSGHRMVVVKRQLVVFGGFHDNLRDYKYFNDLHIFDLDTRTWNKIEPSGNAPLPRSACNMAALADGRIAIFGGYSKTRVLKDIDKGHVHMDLFLLTPEKNDTTGLKWRWVSAKFGGIQRRPRCSMPLAIGPNQKAYSFGGVYDIEDTDENINGIFYRDLHCLDVDKLQWNTVHISKKVEVKKFRRRQKNLEEDGSIDGDDDECMDVDMEVDDPMMTKVSEDGIFTVKVGPVPSTSSANSVEQIESEKTCFWPRGRMNCGLAVKNGMLYLYGGAFEEGDRQNTLNDFYSLDLNKLQEWNTLLYDDFRSQEWYDSLSESEQDDTSDYDSDEQKRMGVS